MRPAPHRDTRYSTSRRRVNTKCVLFHNSVKGLEVKGGCETGGRGGNDSGCFAALSAADISCFPPAGLCLQVRRTVPLDPRAFRPRLRGRLPRYPRSGRAFPRSSMERLARSHPHSNAPLPERRRPEHRPLESLRHDGARRDRLAAPWQDNGCSEGNRADVRRSLPSRRP